MADKFGKQLKQGDVVQINFSPTKGHEQSGFRPAIIVSGDDYNRVSKFKHVVPVTRTKRPYPLHIHLAPDSEVVHGDIEVEQERAVDISARPYQVLGHISDAVLAEILNGIRLIHGF